jgi:uncharacterized protein with PIN domain
MSVTLVEAVRQLLTIGIVSGDHTRTIRIATPSIGGLMKFAVKTVTCMGCKTPLRANNSKDKSLFIVNQVTSPTDGHLADGAVCDNCRPKIGELYHKQVTTLSDLQVRFSRLWTQCQRCQGSLHQVGFSARSIPLKLTTVVNRMFCVQARTVQSFT